MLRAASASCAQLCRSLINLGSAHTHKIVIIKNMIYSEVALQYMHRDTNKCKVKVETLEASWKSHH